MTAPAAPVSAAWQRARRAFATLTLALAATLLLTAPVVARAESAVPRINATDRVLGDANAPVTVIEYGSLACPHCAEWQMGSFYAFKERFVDTGRVRFVFRDMLTEPVAEATQAAAVARCSAPEQYYEVLHTFYRWQSTARNFGPVSEWYDRAIAVSGRTREQIDACVQDPATLAHIRDTMNGGIAAGVAHTPTFFVNGQMTADGSLETLGTAIDGH
ncbi:DsbA family protein [soil metagenome]